MFLKLKKRTYFLLSILAVTICSGIVNGQEIDDLNLSKLSSLEQAKREAEDFENLVKLIKPSIVVVESVDRIGREGGRGTGFVVSPNGIIATNFHVIGEHRDFKIRFADGNSFSPKEILAVDRENDLALIKIDALGLPTLQLGDSDQITPGQSVFSIGNPLFPINSPRVWMK